MVDAANTSGPTLAAAAEDGQPSRHPYAYADAVPAPVAFVLGAAFAAVRLACLLLGSLVYVACARIKAPRIGLTRLAMWCFGVLSLKVDDRRAKGDAAETPIVVLAPHHGLLEGLFAAYYFDARPMMMATFARLPVIGSIVRANGALLVELKRHKKGSSVAPADAKPSAAARQALATHAAEFKGGRPVAVLPEGTTHNGAALLKFFEGAFSARAGAARLRAVFEVRRRLVLRHVDFPPRAAALRAVPAHDRHHPPRDAALGRRGRVGLRGARAGRNGGGARRAAVGLRREVAERRVRGATTAATG